MIINIPLQIDDAAIEGKLKAEYETRVIEEVSRRLDDILKDYDETYVWGNKKSPRNGLDARIGSVLRNRIDDFIEENCDEIVAKAAKDLGARLARTKKGKAILEKYEEETK